MWNRNISKIFILVVSFLQSFVRACWKNLSKLKRSEQLSGALELKENPVTPLHSNFLWQKTVYCYTHSGQYLFCSLRCPSRIPISQAHAALDIPPLEPQQGLQSSREESFPFPCVKIRNSDSVGKCRDMICFRPLCFIVFWAGSQGQRSPLVGGGRGGGSLITFGYNGRAAKLSKCK